MEKLPQFITHHWFLVGLFIIAFIGLVIEEARRKSGGHRLTPLQATHLMNRENGWVLDIRDINAFQDGHVIGAIHMPALDVEKNIKRLEKDKERPMIIACAMGQKSVAVMNLLRKNGFEKLFILAGGMTAWKTAGLPVVKK